MSVVAESSGTLSTSGGGTEDFLDNIPTVGEFTLHVDRSDMVDGDVIVVRLYQMVLAGGTARVVQARTYYGAAPADEQIVVLGPIANELSDANALRVSVTQTLGTAGVSLPWKVLNIGAALRPTTVNRTLDVSAGGEAGVDWANVGSPTTTVGLSGTTVKAATDVAEAVMSALVEAGLTLREAQRLFAAVLLGKVSGAGTVTIVFRDVGDTKDRVTATVDVDGNRSAVTLDDT